MYVATEVATAKHVYECLKAGIDAVSYTHLLVWFPLAAYLALSGDWTHAAGLLLYCGLIVTNIDLSLIHI